MSRIRTPVGGLGFPFRDRAKRASSPDPGGDESSPCFIAWHDTPSRAKLLQAWDRELESVWFNVEDRPQRLVATPGGAIVCGEFHDDPRAIDAAGNTLWTWTRPASSNLTWDAAPDGSGGAYLAFPWNDETRIYHVDSTGTGILTASLTPGVLGMTMVQAESICLSPDGSTLVALALDPTEEDAIDLVGISTATGSVAWQKRLASSIPPTFAEIWFVTVRTIPNANAVAVGYTAASGGSGVVTVRRLDFSSASFDLEPAVTWTATPAGTGPYLTAFTVSPSGVYAGYDADGISHVVTKLALEDGAPIWLWSEANFMDDFSYVEAHGLAVAEGIVFVSLGADFTAFPNEGWGFALLDDDTGLQMSADDFPLEAYLSGAAVALSYAPGQLETSDGFSITTTDGTPITTSE